MENNQNHPPAPRKPKMMAPRDMLLIALAVLVMTRIDWAHMNSFHYLILFLLFLCFMLRWTNMRKEANRKQAMERYKAEMEAEAAKKAADAPAEEVPAEDVTVDGEAVPAPEAPAEETPAAEEKTEE